MDPVISHKYAELSFAADIRDVPLLEMYLSLAREIPEKAAMYFDRVSRIYADQGNSDQARRFHSLSKKAEEE